MIRISSLALRCRPKQREESIPSFNAAAPPPAGPRVNPALDMSMHLSNHFLSWPYGCSSRSGTNVDHIHSAYETWRHAKDCISDEPTKFDRIDCISTLRRAINVRLKSIESEYKISSLPSPRSSKQMLEKLQDYGLVRPAIIKDLLSVRNSIEHDDTDPPDVDRCRFYVDIVWYFLKSTDGIVDMKPEEIEYEDEDTPSKLHLVVRPELGWTVSVDGEIDKKYLFNNASNLSIELTRYVVGTLVNSKGLTSFKGSFAMSDDLRVRIAREYFGATGYFYEDHV